jgi:hypothetical protein
MPHRFWAPAMLVVLLACATAQAAPVTVNLRVEGSSSTIFEGPVTTDGKVITKGADTLACDGTTNPGNTGPGPTITSALDDASLAAGFPWESTFFNDFFVKSIAGEASTSTQFWGYALNYRPVEIGGCQQQVSGGDEVLFAFDFFGADFSERPLLRLSGPGRAVTGQPVSVVVDQFKLVGAQGTARELQQGPAPGAVIGGAQTGPDGTATVTFTGSGLQRLKAARGDAIRSNQLLLCVSDTGTGDCGVPAEQLGASTQQGQVHDSAAPAARISGPRQGRTYRRGPRLLKGVVADDPSGVREVKIAMRRHVRGRSCQWWSGRRERFVGTGCKKVFFFAIGSNRNWSYLLPRALPAGRYVLDVKAFDGRRNRDEKFVPGRNRVVFKVVSRRARAAAASARRTRGARVDVMVVGTGGALVEATKLRARPTVVRAAGRTCKVAGSTPLAALAPALRRTDTRWHVRDFGTCERRRAGSSAQLFVDRVDGDRNRGQDGWVYKVNDLARSVGAADVSGGRLRSGDRVLWFFCALDAGSASCQRSLRVLPAARKGATGSALRVRVLAYDNERRSVPAGGARVALSRRGGVAEATVVADASGVASVPLGAPGRHVIAATAAGAVPSFPVAVGVR